MIKRKKGLSRTAPLKRQVSSGSARPGITGFSGKKKKQRNEYGKRRKEFFEKEENQYCKVRVKGCMGRATEPHHPEGRESEQELLDLDGCIAVCRWCHQYLGDHPEWAIVHGFTKSRLTIN